MKEENFVCLVVTVCFKSVYHAGRQSSQQRTQACTSRSWQSNRDRGFTSPFYQIEDSTTVDPRQGASLELCRLGLYYPSDRLSLQEGQCLSLAVGDISG